MGICESCCRADEGESSDERVSLLRDGGSSSSGHGGGGVDSGDGFSSGGSSGSAGGGSSTSSTVRDNNAGSNKANKEKLAAQYYQSIIDEANSKFISSSTFRTPKNRRDVSLSGSGVDEWKIRLAAAKVNLSLLQQFDSPHGCGVAKLCLAANDKVQNIVGGGGGVGLAVSNSGSTNSSSSSSSSSSSNSRPSSLQEQVVLDILNEPVIIASQLEVVIDEIAELVASNALRFRVEEGGDSSLVSKFSIL